MRGISVVGQNVLNSVKIQLHVTNSAVRIHAITGAGAPVQAVGPHLRESAMTDRKASLKLSVLVMLLLRTCLSAKADPNQLVEVDGTATKCSVNQQVKGALPNRPGDAIAFSLPKFGFCGGVIQYDCATGTKVEGAFGAFYYASVHRTCIGTFTTLDKSLSELQGQISAQTKDIRSLSDSVGVLTERLNETEAEIRALKEGK
jgi:hypothetical protein